MKHLTILWSNLTWWHSFSVIELLDMMALFDMVAFLYMITLLNMMELLEYDGTIWNGASDRRLEYQKKCHVQNVPVNGTCYPIMELDVPIVAQDALSYEWMVSMQCFSSLKVSETPTWRIVIGWHLHGNIDWWAWPISFVGLIPNLQIGMHVGLVFCILYP